MNQVEFLEALWSPSPPGFIQIWRLQGRTSFYLRAPVGAAGYTGTDVYTGVALAARNHGRKHRCPADQASAIPGLWADIDVNGGPEHKTGAAPSVQAAIDLAQAIAPPTILVNSGYGVQAWWLFHQPWIFADRADQAAAAAAAAQWQLLHRRRAERNGFSLDHAHDLARLLRLPGTLNGKGGRQAPVTVIHRDGPRHSIDVLCAIAAGVGPVNTQLSTSDIVTGGAPVDIGQRQGLNPLLFQALLANSPEFSDSWHHRGTGRKHWTTSEYDLSLCSLAAQAGWTDPQLADLVVAHRARWDTTGHKARRVKYLEDTIARARVTGERDGALKKLRELAHTPVQEAA